MDFKNIFNRDATIANRAPVNQPPVDNTSEKGSGTPKNPNKDTSAMDTVDKKIQEGVQEGDLVKKDPQDPPSGEDLRDDAARELEFSPPEPES